MQITGYVNYKQFADQINAFPKGIKAWVRREMKRAADVVVTRAKQLAPVDTGLLKRSSRSRQATSRIWDDP